MIENPINFYYEQEPKDCTFYSVCIDITHRCNMECANCYIPIRDIDDLDKERLFEALEQIPKKELNGFWYSV